MSKELREFFHLHKWHVLQWLLVLLLMFVGYPLVIDRTSFPTYMWIILYILTLLYGMFVCYIKMRIKSPLHYVNEGEEGY